ncbi:hypothetical protein SDC9_148764 [bioreactor metagenome]|uniref:Uncharacterized protein n=1 Tax=bioreactor metagenome TaxID=1076179 RepID=A0A645EHS2_9ZZZZ
MVFGYNGFVILKKRGRRGAAQFLCIFWLFCGDFHLVLAGATPLAGAAAVLRQHRVLCAVRHWHHVAIAGVHAAVLGGRLLARAKTQPHTAGTGRCAGTAAAACL